MPKPKPEKVCSECNTTTDVKKRRPDDIFLCDTCIKLEKYTYITKGQIKTDYFLKDGDIENLDMSVAKSSYGRRYSAHLYKLSDIKTTFCQKYNIQSSQIDDKLDELRQLKELKSSISKRRKTTKIADRKTLLENELAKYGLTLRSDSKLCAGFINGSIHEDVDNVVERMCQMKFLFDYCDMDNCFDQAKREQADEFDAGYFPDCSLFDQAEMIALKKSGGYPNVWPWLQ